MPNYVPAEHQVENTQQAVGSGNDPSLEEIIARFIASLDISLYATMKPAFKSFLESFAKWLKNKVNREQGINFTIPDIEFTRRGVREALITLGKTDSSRGLKFCEEHTAAVMVYSLVCAIQAKQIATNSSTQQFRLIGHTRTTIRGL
ncbi:hypothetical protein TVAGG3_0594140, partial [Trichomonas vaginalis G3]|uniref:hypothetical protein n=1 Tax=Trichomonas vaginalis (strain ATCC PRA-98 / G3) TaxID=412133 RepID=UPI0021E54880